MKRNSFIPGLIWFFIFVLFTASLFVVDVNAVGPSQTEVGYSTLNMLFHNATGVNSLFDVISDICAVAAISVALIYAGLGLYQLVTKKSFIKVDYDLYVFALFLVLMALVYVVFELIVINYKPILEDGELVAGFPSSHTILSLCVCGYSLVINDITYKHWTPSKYIDLLSILIVFVTITSRLISGVHWLTDIIGAVLISASLVCFFKSTLIAVRNRIN